MAAERQVPGGPFVNEVGTAQRQVPGGPFVNETVAVGGGAYTLTAAQGSYSLAGQDAAMLTARALAADQGSYSVGGQDASLLAARLLVAAQGTYEVTGQTAGLTYTPLAGAYTLTADSGTYTVAGQDAALLAARKLAADQGGYTFTGQDAALLRGYVVAADHGSYAVTGQTADFSRTYRVVAATGSYSLMGQTASLVYSNATVLPTVQKLPTWHYVPGPLTFTLDGMTRELQRISQASYGAAPVVQYIPTTAAPTKPRDGMTVYADGDAWNPGSGAGVYVYTAGNWVFLGGSAGAAQSEAFIVPISDQTTALTTGTAKMTWRAPYAFTLTDVRASVSTAQTSGAVLTFDVNESGTSVLSTKVTIDNGEKTSTTAATARVISDSAIADDAELTFDIDQVGDGTAKGAVITLIGHQ